MANGEITEQDRKLEMELKHLQDKLWPVKMESEIELGKPLSLLSAGIVGWVDDF